MFISRFSLAHTAEDSNTGFALLNEAECSTDNAETDGQNQLNSTVPMGRAARYELASLQMIGLCTTMIHKCAIIQQQYADGTDKSYEIFVLPIYSEAFRMRLIPLLQALARLCCDSRRKVRETAFMELQVRNNERFVYIINILVDLPAILHSRNAAC